MESLFTYRDEHVYCHHSLDKQPRPEAFVIHAHEVPEVYCFLSGHGQYLVEGTTYSLAPGDILLMRPAETHKLLIEPDAPYRRIAIHFAPHLFDGLDSSGALLRSFYDRPLGQNNQYPAAAYPQLRQIILDLSLTEGMERIQILSRLMLLLTQIAEIYRATDVPETTHGIAAALVSYINTHLFEPTSLSQISQQFARSPSQISRIFRESTGTSVWEYVVIKRLLAARAMLQRGERAANVCLSCGFENYSAFYRIYKKRFGHAPSADRP